MKNFVQNGKNLDILASAEYSSGQLVIEGGIVGVAVTDIPSGGTGAVATEGVFAFPKKSAATLIQGDVARYDGTAKNLDANTANPGIGHVVMVDGNTVHVKVYGYIVDPAVPPAPPSGGS